MSAQVGHDPSHSPYRDVARGGVGLVTAGYFGGSRGSVDVGLADGPTFGTRYEAALSGTIGVSFGLAYGRTTRFVVQQTVVQPTGDTLWQKTGPSDNDFMLADVGLQLVLTGRKTWHGLAPYLGASLGLAADVASPPDTSGYDFGTKFTFAPQAGIRWYPARRVSVRADFRAVAWKLSYPIAYKVPDEAGTRVLPLDASLGEYTWHPWVTIGVGWTF